MPETVLFDRYRLLEPAGVGGSAEVWRALDQQTGEDVAIKRLHPVVFADEAGRRRLRREFGALRSIDEPHIVRVRDLLISDREAALVLDFVPGESLARRLARHAADGTRMAPETAVAVVGDVAAALAAAHAAGIVHRDVTPGNVLLTPDGDARLTDFGIAHGDGEATAVTAIGLLMGTMRYLAPEQLRGGISTPASDLHALAAVAYEMLAGRPAYDATSPVELAEAQRTGPPPLDGVPPAVDAVVRRAMAVDPADRPADVGAFAGALGAALADRPTTAMPIASRDRTAVIPIAAIDAEEPASSGVAARSRVAAGAAGPSAERPRARQSGRRGLPAPVAVALGLVIAVGLLAAAAGLGEAPTGRSPAASPLLARDPSPSAPPSAAPSATPTASATATAAPEKGKGKGKGDGKGGKGG